MTGRDTWKKVTMSGDRWKVEDVFVFQVYFCLCRLFSKQEE